MTFNSSRQALNMQIAFFSGLFGSCNFPQFLWLLFSINTHHILYIHLILNQIPFKFQSIFGFFSCVNVYSSNNIFFKNYFSLIKRQFHLQSIYFFTCYIVPRPVNKTGILIIKVLCVLPCRHATICFVIILDKDRCSFILSFLILYKKGSLY